MHSAKLEVTCSFVTRANELLAQRRKATANYKRLCSIMKDRRPSTSTLSSTECEEGADPGAQLAALMATVRELAGRLRRLGEGLDRTNVLEAQLAMLSL